MKKSSYAIAAFTVTMIACTGAQATNWPIKWLSKPTYMSMMTDTTVVIEKCCSKCGQARQCFATCQQNC